MTELRPTEPGVTGEGCPDERSIGQQRVVEAGVKGEHRPAEVRSTEELRFAEPGAPCERRFPEPGAPCERRPAEESVAGEHRPVEPDVREGHCAEGGCIGERGGFEASVPDQQSLAVRVPERGEQPTQQITGEGGAGVIDLGVGGQAGQVRRAEGFRQVGQAGVVRVDDEATTAHGVVRACSDGAVWPGRRIRVRRGRAHQEKRSGRSGYCKDRGCLVPSAFAVPGRSSGARKARSQPLRFWQVTDSLGPASRSGAESRFVRVEGAAAFRADRHPGRRRAERARDRAAAAAATKRRGAPRRRAAVGAAPPRSGRVEDVEPTSVPLACTRAGLAGISRSWGAPLVESYSRVTRAAGVT